MNNSPEIQCGGAEMTREAQGAARVLALARGRMDSDDVAFWNRVAAPILRNGGKLRLLVHHEPSASCDFEWEVIPNQLTDVDPKEFSAEWIQEQLPQTLSPRDMHLLELESLWRGRPVNSLAACQRELTVAFVRERFCALLDEYQPNLVVIWNGLHAVESLLADMVRKIGANVLWVERGPFPGTLQVDEKGILAASSVAGEVQWQWSDAAFASRWQGIMDQVCRYSLEGGGSWWQQPQSGGSTTLRSRLGISDEQKVMVFVGQVDADSQNIFFAPRFEDNLAAWTWMVNAVGSREGLFLLGKHHPKSSCPSVRYDAASANCANARWESEISVEDALGIADVVVAVNSSVLYEALMRGLPVVSLGDGLLSGKDIAYEVTDLDAPEPDIDTACAHHDLPVRLQRFRDFGANLLAHHLFAMRPELEALGVRGGALLGERLAAHVSPNVDTGTLPETQRTDPITLTRLAEQEALALPPLTYNLKRASNSKTLVVFASFTRFWEESTEACLREKNLLCFLSTLSADVCMLFTGVLSAADATKISQLFPSFGLVATNRELSGTISDGLLGKLRHGESLRSEASTFAESKHRAAELLRSLGAGTLILHGLRHRFLAGLRDDPAFADMRLVVDASGPFLERLQRQHGHGLLRWLSPRSRDEIGRLRGTDLLLAGSEDEKAALRKWRPMVPALTVGSNSTAGGLYEELAAWLEPEQKTK